MVKLCGKYLVYRKYLVQLDFISNVQEPIWIYTLIKIIVLIEINGSFQMETFFTSTVRNGREGEIPSKYAIVIADDSDTSILRAYFHTHTHSHAAQLKITFKEKMCLQQKNNEIVKCVVHNTHTDCRLRDN